jgi:hypothetical protein
MRGFDGMRRAWDSRPSPPGVRTGWHLLMRKLLTGAAALAVPFLFISAPSAHAACNWTLPAAQKLCLQDTQAAPAAQQATAPAAQQPATTPCDAACIAALYPTTPDYSHDTAPPSAQGGQAAAPAPGSTFQQPANNGSMMCGAATAMCGPPPDAPQTAGPVCTAVYYLCGTQAGDLQTQNNAGFSTPGSSQP